ncbi:MAG TPA: VOC family protein [Candidatus Baltobacteraceae bacterium]
MLKHVAPVFHVADLQRSIVFYQDRLGFEVNFKYGDFYAGLVRYGCHLHLRLADEQRERVAVEPDENVDACFTVSDASALASEFSKADVRFAIPLREMPYGTEFYVSDPDGNVLVFLQAG